MGSIERSATALFGIPIILRPKSKSGDAPSASDPLSCFEVGPDVESITEKWRTMMPFPPQIPGIFDRPHVEAFGPNQLGVYGLFRESRWIYIGKGDIRQRLLAHLGGDNPRITRERPTHWVSEVTPNMDGREIQLIQELDPVCNQRIG
jgi:hypothetical protein